MNTEQAKKREYYDGLVGGPGKFEGEPAYVIYFWDQVMEGFSDDEYTDGSGYLVSEFKINPEDCSIWPELLDHERILLWESDQGFVYHDFVMVP